MSKTCKSPRTVLVTAWIVAKAVLPKYSHRSSPKKFTQHQLFACLVLKAFLKTDYRGLVAHLQDSPDWCEAVELAEVPHFTTFQKAARRLLRIQPVAGLLDETVGQIMGQKRRVPLAAIDSTGLESRHTSRYFIERRSRVPDLWQTTQYTRFPKLGLLVDCSNHVVLGYLTGQGPKSDIRDLAPTLSQTTSRVRIEWLTADAGYDSESNHRLCRDEHGIRTLIPPTDREAGERTLSSADANAIRQKTIRAALASGDGREYDKASVRLRNDGPKLLVPSSRPDAHGSDPQHHDPLTV
jgi:hypothetical protein